MQLAREEELWSLPVALGMFRFAESSFPQAPSTIRSISRWLIAHRQLVPQNEARHCSEVRAHSRVVGDMALRIWRRILQGLGIAALLVIVTMGALIWWLNAGDDCFMFGASYTRIGELNIDGRLYHVYGAVTGFQDKVRIVQISATKIPESVCKPEHTSQVVDTETVDDAKVVSKVVVRRKPDGGPDLRLEYSPNKQRDPYKEWEGIAIELR